MPLTEKNSAELKKKFTDIKDALLAGDMKLSDGNKAEIEKLFGEKEPGLIYCINDYFENFGILGNLSMSMTKGEMSGTLHSICNIHQSLKDNENDERKFWEIIGNLMNVLEEFDKSNPAGTETLTDALESERHVAKERLAAVQKKTEFIEEQEHPKEETLEKIKSDVKDGLVTLYQNIYNEISNDFSINSEDRFELFDKLYNLSRLSSELEKAESKEKFDESLKIGISNIFVSCADYCSKLPESSAKNHVTMLLKNNFVNMLGSPEIVGKRIAGMDFGDALSFGLNLLSPEYIKDMKEAEQRQIKEIEDRQQEERSRYQVNDRKNPSKDTKKIGRNLLLSDKDHAILNGNGTTEYGNLRQALQDYANDDIDYGRGQTRKLYENARAYLMKKDTTPWHDYGKERVAAAAKVMAQTAIDLLQGTPDLEPRKKLMQEMKQEILRSKVFRDELIKELPEIAASETGCKEDAAELCAFTAIVNQVCKEKGKEVLISGKMWGNQLKIDAANEQIGKWNEDEKSIKDVMLRISADDIRNACTPKNTVKKAAEAPAAEKNIQQAIK